MYGGRHATMSSDGLHSKQATTASNDPRILKPDFGRKQETTELQLDDLVRRAIMARHEATLVPSGARSGVVRCCGHSETSELLRLPSEVYVSAFIVHELTFHRWAFSEQDLAMLTTALASFELAENITDGDTLPPVK